MSSQTSTCVQEHNRAGTGSDLSAPVEGNCNAPACTDVYSRVLPTFAEGPRTSVMLGCPLTPGHILRVMRRGADQKARNLLRLHGADGCDLPDQHEASKRQGGELSDQVTQYAAWILKIHKTKPTWRGNVAFRLCFGSPVFAGMSSLGFFVL